MLKLWNIRFALPAALLLATMACSPIEARHGYVPDEESIGRLQPGVHDVSTVTRLFGAPLTIANFKGETWFYIRRHTEKFAFFEEEVVRQDVLAVKFDGRGIVSEVKTYSMKDGQEVEYEGDETPTRGKELNLIQQLLGNLGRFGTNPN